jgi:hypothetical protein
LIKSYVDSASITDPRDQYRLDTADGRRVRVPAVAVEVVSGIAVLGVADWDDGPDAVEFDQWCTATEPVPICRDDPLPTTEGLRLFADIEVLVLDHRRRWVTWAAGTCLAGRPSLDVAPSQYVRSTAVGGPIVNTAGELVAVVSEFDNRRRPLVGIENTFDDHHPRPVLALPAWVLHAIAAGEAHRPRAVPGTRAGGP